MWKAEQFIRTVDDIMEFTERYMYCINGKMICIDFKKAFDTVSRDFLFKTLQAFGFGYSFIQWIHTFYMIVWKHIKLRP